MIRTPSTPASTGSEETPDDAVSAQSDQPDGSDSPRTGSDRMGDADATDDAFVNAGADDAGDDDRLERVRRAAYRRYEARGDGPGDAASDWADAEAEVDAEQRTR